MREGLGWDFRKMIRESPPSIDFRNIPISEIEQGRREPPFGLVPFLKDKWEKEIIKVTNNLKQAAKEGKLEIVIPEYERWVMFFSEHIEKSLEDTYPGLKEVIISYMDRYKGRHYSPKDEERAEVFVTRIIGKLTQVKGKELLSRLDKLEEAVLRNWNEQRILIDLFSSEKISSPVRTLILKKLNMSGGEQLRIPLGSVEDLLLKFFIIEYQLKNGQLLRKIENRNLDWFSGILDSLMEEYDWEDRQILLNAKDNFLKFYRLVKLAKGGKSVDAHECSLINHIRAEADLILFGQGNP